MSSLKLITVMFSALFLLIVSAVLHYSELYIMSATLVAVPVISYVLGRTAVRGLRCSRENPTHVREGEPFSILLRLHGNTNRLGSIDLDDRLPEWVEKDESGQGASIQMSPKGITLTYNARAKKRGEHTLGPLRLRISDPLGFFQFNCDYRIVSQLVVLPCALEIPGLQSRSSGSFGEYQFEGTGAKGSGIDFHGVREYQHGDELRRVHWHSTARLGHLNVIEFEHSRARDVVIAIDLHEGSEVGTGLHTSLEYAVKIAAGLAEQTLMLGSAARLACAGLQGPASASGTGVDHLLVLLDALARVEANSGETLSRLLMGELDSIRHDSAVLCLTPTIDDNLPAYIQTLAHKGARVQLILINLEDDLPVRIQQLAWQAVAAGASLAVVDCSREHTACRLRWDYAA